MDDSQKQALCSKMEQLVTKLDSIHATFIRIVKADTDTDCLKGLSANKDYHLGLLKRYEQTAESENQTSSVSSTSPGDKDLHKTIIDTVYVAIENDEKKFEVSSRHSVTNGSTREPSIVSWRSLRRQQIEEMELKHL